MAHPAYVTVTDAAGRVLFRRPATQAEIEEAMQVADAADAEAQAVLKRIAQEREQALAAAAALQSQQPSAEIQEEAQTKLEEPPPEPVRARTEAAEDEPEEPAIQGMGDDDFDFLNREIASLGEPDDR